MLATNGYCSESYLKSYLLDILFGILEFYLLAFLA